ncbi:MAG: PKD domain-containing protein [Methanomicrobiales archaeon]|jgi:PKD repeat protein|nr:PKD domain-containing protein [Methanomicrobiales archaeon]
MDGNKLSGFVISLTVILLTISVVSAIPPLPTEFYGNVYVNGNPAPAGTVITATIGEEVRGSFMTSEMGLYGGPSLFDDRLIVSPTEDDISRGITEIAFLIGNENAEQTAKLLPGVSQQLDLSIGGNVPPIVTHVPTQVPTSPILPLPTTPDPNLIAAFTADITAGSNPLRVAFTDLSTGNPTMWYWEFGDGEVSTERNPVHTYQKIGLFDVTLTVSHEINENQKIELSYILVTGTLPPPVAMFEATPLAGSVPLHVAFTDISIGPPTAWIWEFGDGEASTERNPVHTYTTPGLYSVTLKVENEEGGSNSIIREHYISASEAGSSIIADFSAGPISGLVPLTVTFRDLSSGNPTMWYWDFGDGQSSMSANPEHTYTIPGMYTVSLTASKESETDTREKTGYITASSHAVGLIASFTASPTGGTAPLSVEFKDTSVGNPTMWYWEFGDGETATVANPKHIYTTPGTYTVKLTVSNQVTTDSVVIENAIVVIGSGGGDQVDFVASPTHGILPLTVQFTDVSNCNPVRWLWEFGDGAISTEQHPKHVYKNAGAYTVKLRVTDSSGTMHEVKKQGFIHIEPAQPGSHGKIEISLAPDRAAIILNGAKVGETAFLKTYTIRSVPPGTHQLRLVREGFQDFNKEIIVLPGGTTRVQGNMMQTSSPGGTISVSTSPDGAQVLLDGLSLGEAPIWKPGVSVGPHALTVTAGSHYDWARDIYVSSGEVSYVTAVLFPQWWTQDTGVVMISSIPGDGMVFVDGIALGQTPVTVSELEAGEHMVRIELLGYEPWEDSITVHKGRTSYVVATLK